MGQASYLRRRLILSLANEAFKKHIHLYANMRVSIFIGLFIAALGLFMSYLADELIQTHTYSALQLTAKVFAAVLFVSFSATLLGLGAALIIHWLFGFATSWKAFAAELFLSFATFFVGIGAALVSTPWLTAVHLFFTFFVASCALFIFSFASLFGGIAIGMFTIRRYIRKRFHLSK